MSSIIFQPDTTSTMSPLTGILLFGQLVESDHFLIVVSSGIAFGAIIPQSLLLDGQQRMTSLYQVTLRGKVVETVTPKNKKVKRWFYIDIRKSLDPSIDREEAILGLPEDRIIKNVLSRTYKKSIFK